MAPKIALGALVRRVSGRVLPLRPSWSVDGVGLQNRQSSRSTLDGLIPPEITNDAFSETIVEIASRAGVREILEIGSSSGSGSTESWVQGALLNCELPRLHCIEVSIPRFVALSERWREHGFVNCYNVSSVPLELFPSPAEVTQFYYEAQSDLSHYQLELVLHWLQQDIDYLRTHGLSGNGIRHIKELHDLNTFDAVLIDGSEFTGSAELDEVYGARFILMDDTRTFKNWNNFERLRKDTEYRLHSESSRTRHGYAVFERIH